MVWKSLAPNTENKEKDMRKILLTVTTVLALSAFSVQADLLAVDHNHNWNKAPASSGGYAAAVKSAKAEQKKAKKVGFEWRDIGKFLKTADKKYKAGDVKGAMKLVAKAKEQSLLGQQQAKDQANAGPYRF